MSLAAPWALAAAALTIPLVAWYVLRSRRPSVTVASTFLWRRTDRSVAAAVPWQRFRPDATFWLVLLALLVGALALAQPFLRVPAELGDHTIVILDGSGSMLAVEDGPTRLELARRRADGLVDRLGPGQQVSVVEAGSRARVLLSASDDPSAIRDALRSIRPTHGPADLRDAFTLASALERPGQVTVTHLLTDGAVPPEAASAAPAGLLVEAVGQDRPNLAVTRLQTVPLGAGTTQAFVQVRNFGALAARSRLVLAVDGQDVVSEELQLAPRGTSDRILEVRGGDGAVLTVRVEPAGEDLTGAPAADALTIDDRAYAVLTAPRELDVLIAGPGNLFLEAAFAAVGGTNVTTALRVPPDLEEIDLLVVDRIVGPEEPTVPTLYVAPDRWPTGVTAGPLTDRPAVTFQDPDHELLDQVDLSGVGIAEATPLEAPALATLVSGPSGDLVVAGRLDGTPVVLLAFDLLSSNLPLETAWPVLVANTTSWLTGPPATSPTTAGSTLSLPTPPGTEGIGVEPPGGAPVSLDVAAPRLTVDQVGVWRLSYEGPVSRPPLASIAVNVDPAESDLARARPDPVAERGHLGGGAAEAATEGRRQLGPDLLVVVLLLVLGEWVWTHGLRPWRRRRIARSRQARSVTAGSR